MCNDKANPWWRDDETPQRCTALNPRTGARCELESGHETGPGSHHRSYNEQCHGGADYF